MSSVVWETFADVNNTTLEEQSVGSKGVNHAKPWVRGLLLPQRNTDRNQNYIKLTEEIVIENESRAKARLQNLEYN